MTDPLGYAPMGVAIALMGLACLVLAAILAPRGTTAAARMAGLATGLPFFTASNLSILALGSPFVPDILAARRRSVPGTNAKT
ncbi:MAG: hypothetical protein AAF366_15980 [Pseudomonadota bacterium]